MFAALKERLCRWLKAQLNTPAFHEFHFGVAIPKSAVSIDGRHRYQGRKSVCFLAAKTGGTAEIFKTSSCYRAESVFYFQEVIA